MTSSTSTHGSAWLAALTLALIGCSAIQLPGAAATNARVEQDVPVASRTVWSGSYAADIQPIFDQYCTSCHGPTRAENGLRLDSRENAMRGTQYGPVIIPGSAGTSTLLAVVQGNTAPEIQMPHQGRKLTKNRVQNILLWIDAGAPSK